jgi:hypothetical protein
MSSMAVKGDAADWKELAAIVGAGHGRLSPPTFTRLHGECKPQGSSLETA